MISNAYANKILNVITGVSGSISQANYVYLGLCVSEPNPSTGAVNSEPTAPSYKRRLVGGALSYQDKAFGSADDGIITNDKEIQFNTARESWGEGSSKLMYWFLSETTSGVATMWGEINDGNGIEIAANTVPTFYEGELKASIDVALSE